MFDIPEELKKLPQLPGVYLMKDKNGAVIYVGKAVNLKNRVRSYFRESNPDYKAASMAPNIAEFEVIVTDNEIESLVLENNLIKKYYPKYNIKLKDNKTYPYIKITVNEQYPRVFITRDRLKDKARYLGPYPSATSVRETLDAAHKIWPIRKCAKTFPRDINRDRPCLNKHIGGCLAPCTGLVDEAEYDRVLEEAVMFLTGKHAGVLERFEAQMAAYAEATEYEKAAEVRDKINHIKLIHEKQKVEGGVFDQDIVAFAINGDEALFYIFFVRDGKMVGSEHLMASGAESVSDADIMAGFLKRFYSETSFVPRDIILGSETADKELITDWLSQLKGRRVNINVPQRADKARLVELAKKNAALTLEQSGEQIKRDNQRTKGAVKEIADALGIEGDLNRIEAVDISNIHGFESVGSMVVFEEGVPKRSDYRKFKIKDVYGPDDYASVEEVLHRRFTRYKNETAEGADGKFNKLPGLLMVDGGKGQASSAQKVLDDLQIGVPVCGMVKDDNHRTRGLYFNGAEVSLPRTSEGYKLIVRIQDEVHRFALEYHRKLREKSQVKSVLDDIPGIGGTRRKALMKHFGDIDKIKAADMEELKNVTGMNAAAAAAVHGFFRK